MAKQFKIKTDSGNSQAEDDSIGFTEDGPTDLLVGDLLANDKGGSGKSFYGLNGGDPSLALFSVTSEKGVTVLYDAVSGTILYDLEHAPAVLALVQSLGAGEVAEDFDSFSYTIQQGNSGSLSTATVSISFTGENDAPEVIAYYGAVAEGDTTGPATVGEDAAAGPGAASGALVVRDVDATDAVDLAVAGVAAASTLALAGSDTLAAVLAAHGLDEAALLALFGLVGPTTGLPADYPNGSEVGWSFGGAAAGLFDFLNEGASLTLTYAVAARDVRPDGAAAGGAAEATVKVVIAGANDAASIGGADTGQVTEDSGVDAEGFLTVSGKLTVSDLDYGEEHFRTVTDQLGTLGGFFSIDADGNWSYRIGNAAPVVQDLRAGQAATDAFTFRSADGTAHTVTITVNGVDEPGAGGAPTANPDEITVSANDVTFISWDVFLANDTDAETPDQLAISDILDSSGPFDFVGLNFDDKTLAISTTGTGTGSVVYRIVDADGLMAESIITVHVV